MRILMLSWLFLMPICLILLGAEIDVVSGKCLRDQQSLLLQLKANLTFNANESKKLNKWNGSSDCCFWDGVTCDKGGHVTGLSLSGESISNGIYNSSLFNLQYLESLDLSLNNFNSTIPAKIGNLTTLSYLNLSTAGFGGQIPKEISQLTRLVFLDFSTQFLLQVSSLKLENPNLRMLIQKLSNLEELYLDGVNLSASGSEWCQALSSSVPKLRVLSLTNCYLSGPMDQSLEKLQSLSVIRLDNNDLSAPVPSFFAKISNLTSLHLVSCGLNGTFPKEIFQVSTVQIIDLTNNQFLQGSLPEFQQHNSLQRMVLRSTSFSGTLPESVGNLWNLSVFDLSNCQFNGTLPNSMAKLTRLVYLDLSFNKFNGTIPSLKKSKNLSQIVLSHNYLTGPVPLAHFEGLHNLVVVDLQNNSFNGSIPPTLFALPSLEKIQLSNNQFNGQLPEFLNASSSILDTLDIRSNDLEGSLPMSIFKHTKLNILSVSYNRLNGTIQLAMIKRLDNLTSLDLSYNNLSVIASGNSTWSLPPNISRLALASCKLKEFPYLKNQSKLIYLDLSSNQIQGHVPNWIWELGNGSLLHLNLSSNHLSGIQESYLLPKTLNVLDLHLNQLQGKIPILPLFASYIDISNNNLTSPIPFDIGNNLSQTIFFSLSNNYLTGVIPKSICNASNIQVLDLSNNTLEGRIPPCISAMSQSLVILNLRRNNFTNPIPNAFPEKCSLRTLDLNGNRIDGGIPKSLANCTELEVLNLGNNNLTGNFPCLLKNISKLRVLVLRSNKFHGRIGCPETNGTWTVLQIVDLALNNFDGPLPRECLRKWQAMFFDVDEPQSEFSHLQFAVLRFSDVYYQDAITVTSKGLEMELVKILTVFTSIDLSCNKFQGSIPSEVGLLHALYALNVSHNTLTGKIPPTIGNLRQLESLDLSNNKLSGEIPKSLASLSFLSFLDLSVNNLVGMIPVGTQIQSFLADSFVGNPGLCGAPLPRRCNNSSKFLDTGTKVAQGLVFAWQSIYTGIGFGVGAGAVFALLMFWDEGKTWLEDSIDKILLVILPMMGCTYKPRQEWDDEDTEDEDSDSTKDHEEDEMEDQELQGRYCVFCSKLDISRKKVIHDPRCTCHSPLNSSSSFSSSSSSDST